MALVARTLGQVVRYVSRLDPAKGTPEEATEATAFLLAPLSARAFAAIQDATSSNRTKPVEEGKEPEVEQVVRLNERCYAMAQASLRGWERFRDAEGNDVPFSVASRVVGGDRVAGASDEAMNRLDSALILELGVQVIKLSQPEAPALKS